MHPEADAFLDAIFDNPDDDTPRLVYADWLQEHGQEDYAQFIRLSIQSYNSSSSKERKQLDSRRKLFWNRMRVVRHDAIVGVSIHDYERGILNGLVTYGDSLVRTITSWWPAMTPPSLSVSGARGFGPRSMESEVVVAVGAHLPWLRELIVLSNSVEAEFLPTAAAEAPLDGNLFGALSQPGVLPRLWSLRIATTHVELPTLRTFAESEVASHLVRLHLTLCTAEGMSSESINVSEHSEPGAVQLALESFLSRHE
jgi:uncharacterized protein (TIGR02996 family)